MSEQIEFMLTVDDLRRWADIALLRGAADAFIPLALQWAERANDEIVKLRAALSAPQPDPALLACVKALREARVFIVDAKPVDATNFWQQTPKPNLLTLAYDAMLDEIDNALRAAGEQEK